MANRRRRGGPGRARGAKVRPRTIKKVGKGNLPARSSSAREDKKDENLVRLNKYLADHGIASRRACDELIEKGKVTVDGEPVSALGTKVDPTTQVVEINGILLKPEGTERRYYLLNKPSGVVCTNEQREVRPRAMDLVTDPAKGRIYTVGRLDEDSMGLIILTNDGEFAQRIAHPRFGVSKTYKVRVQGKISDETLQKVREGVHLSEGKTAGARIIVKRRSVSGSQLEVTIREGKNREVRRVFARVGHKVVSLVRTRIGPLDDRGIKVGRWRPLSRSEVEAMLTLSSEGGPDEQAAPEGGKPGKPGERSTPGEGGRAPRGGARRGAGRGGARRGTVRGEAPRQGDREAAHRSAARRARGSKPARGRSEFSPLDALEGVERSRSSRPSRGGPSRGSASRSSRGGPSRGGASRSSRGGPSRGGASRSRRRR